MSYTMNPHLPKLRAQAAEAVQKGQGIRAVARYIGVHPSTVLRWARRVPQYGRIFTIPTRSSRPHHHPRAIERSIIDRIIELRAERGRCAEVLHAQLIREGTLVSLSTVKRVLDREGLLQKHGPRKVWHQSGERPGAETPGELVEIDSIHVWSNPRRRTHILTMIDVFSRWAYAWASHRLTAPTAVGVVRRARASAPFPFACVQSDHGSEFSRYVTHQLALWRIRHRQIRVRQPNDNAHVERFNRTLQDDLKADLSRFPDNPRQLNLLLSDWLRYYNTERIHLGLNCKTPLEMLPRC